MGFNLDNYETVAERLQRALDTHPDLRIVNDLVHVERNEDGKPIQYIVRAQVFFGDVLKGQDFAEEIVGSSNVNRASALENACTSATGRALSLIGFMGTNPVTKKPERPTRLDMEKDARLTTQAVALGASGSVVINSTPAYTDEQINLALEAISQVPEITSVGELKLFYTGAQDAGLLQITVDGTTLNKVISARKKELEATK